MRRIHYILIAAAVLSVLVIMFAFNKTETTGDVVDCSAPNALIDGVCCLDADADSVCDVPEEVADGENVVAEETGTEYAGFKAMMYLSSDVLASETAFPEDPEKMSSLALDKDKTELADGKKFYGKYYIYTYLDGSYNENIICNIDEYYGTVLSDKFLVEVPAGQKFQTTSVGYEFEGTPSKVRYDLSCVGFDSRLEWKDSYTYDLVEE
ncbi:MAG: hypothetical protein AABX93_00650 [Nanoarchaeota archaeon]